MFNNKFGKVAVLLGGTSNEREISINSGKSVLSSLKKSNIDASGIDPKSDDLEKLKQFDRVFICLHGKDGTDGKIQKFLNINKKNFTKNFPKFKKYKKKGFIDPSTILSRKIYNLKN